MKKQFRFAALLLAAVLLLSLLSGCSATPEQVAQTAESVISLVSEAAELVDSMSEDAAASPEAPQETSPPVQAEEPAAPEAQEPEAEPALAEDGVYTTKEDVALYIYTYGHLPSNFITKKQAQALGWEGGGLDRFKDGASIGGDRFGNNEGLLPKAPGRTWTECDINTMHKSKRGAERIVFSNDGLIYYTGDHYESFELLYGEP